MRRLLDAIYLASGALGAVAILTICATMLSQVAARHAGFNLRGADDITAWACAASAFCPLAYTFRHGEMVRVGLYLDQLGPLARWRAEVFSLVVAAAFAGYLAYWLGNLVFESWRFNDMAQGLLKIPLWIPQSSLVVGAAALFIAIVDELVTVLRGRTPAYEIATRERAARGEFSENV